MPREVREFRLQAVFGVRASARLTIITALLLLLIARPATAEMVFTTPLKTYGLGPLRCAIYTPDAKKIIAAGALGPITMLDAQTGRILLTFNGLACWVYALAVSPNGLRLLSGNGDGTARLWDIATGNLLKTFRISDAYEGCILGVAMSPDANRVATVSTTGKIRLWNSVTQSTLLFDDRSNYSHNLTFSHDGKLIAAATNDFKVRLWDAATGAQLRTFNDHTSRIRCVGFSPDDTKVIAGSEDKSAIAWNTTTGEIVGNYRSPHWILASDYSPDGSRIVTAIEGNNAKIWDAATAKEIRTLPVKAEFVQFSSDGQKVLTFLDNPWVYAYGIQQWNSNTGALINNLDHYADTVNSAALSRDNQWVLTGSSDGVARLWDAADGNLIRSMHAYSAVYGAALSPDEHQIATVSNEALELWDAATGLRMAQYNNESTGISKHRSVAYSRAGDKLAISGEGYAIFERPSMNRLVSIGVYYRLYHAIRFFPDGLQFLTGDSWSYAQVFKINGAGAGIFRGHNSAVYGVDVFPDGNRILTGSTDNSARIWNVASGLTVRTFPSSLGAVYAVAVSPDGNRFLVGSNGMLLYDANSGDLIARFAHNTAIYSAAFSDDGTLALSAGDDGLAMLWRVPVANRVSSGWNDYE